MSFLWLSKQWATVSTQETWISTAPHTSFFLESSSTAWKGLRVGRDYNTALWQLRLRPPGLVTALGMVLSSSTHWLHK